MRSRAFRHKARRHNALNTYLRGTRELSEQGTPPCTQLVQLGAPIERALLLSAQRRHFALARRR